MGEKESAAGTGERTTRGHSLSLDDDKGARGDSSAGSGTAEKSVQWEPHKAEASDAPEQERVARHDTAKNSIGNIR